jgi:type II secretory pathway pseudopilin PulG
MDLAPSPQSSARNPGTDWSFAWPWILGFGLTVYLGLEGGGFDPLVSGQVGIALWWLLLLGAVVGALPRRTPATIAWCALGLLACFAAWTALSLSWTESTERTATDLARVLTYLGALGAAVFTRGPEGLRHTVAAVGAGVAVIAGVALLSRLHPAWFPANETARFFENGRERLSYPVNYWNGLAALIAVGAPLVLHLATGARRIPVQAVAAAALPALALTAFFTLSRGGMAAVAIAVAVYLAFAPDRLPKALTLLVAAGGGAVLVGFAASRDALVHGYDTPLAHDQGTEVLLVTIAVAAVVGLLQAAIALGLARGARPSWARVSRRQSQALVGGAVAVLLVAALAAGAPGKVSRAWHDFKQPSTEPGKGTNRLTSVSGESRYQFWSSAAREFESKPLTGTGSGSFALWWTRDGSVRENVIDAHSLYMQTLGELGLVGLALLAAFIALSLAAGVSRVLGAPLDARPAAAAALAASTPLWVTSVFDWTWQIPVIPVASLLVIAALLTREDAPRPAPRGRHAIALRVATALLAVAAIVAIALPLASTSLLRSSQSESRAEDLGSALEDGRSAQNVEPGWAGPRLQQALVLESARDFDSAATKAAEAAEREPNNWRIWLIRSRLEAERGNADAAIRYYRAARALNPHALIFETS